MEFVVAKAKFVATGVDLLVADENEVFLMKHYVQFVPGSEHADWMVEMLAFDIWMQMWKICTLVFLSPLRWKPLVKMKMVVDLSFLVSKCGTHFSIYWRSLMQEHLASKIKGRHVECKKNILKKKLWRRQKVMKIRGEIIKKLKRGKRKKRKKKRISIFEVHRWHNRKNKKINDCHSICQGVWEEF